ncbi:MAG TPA: hypothetical protein VM425_21775 [Myxococcota bacterium]|nr:hypothetical protein [Myxococcota bacterium]
MLAKTDGGDSADHDCHLVLRSVMRNQAAGGYETDCSTGECFFVWRVKIEVATSVDPGAGVHVLYHLTSDPGWWEAQATYQEGGAPGYRLFEATISEHLFGLEDAHSEERAIELVAFLRMPDGSRLFDHNNYTSDFANTLLDAASAYQDDDGGSCQPLPENCLDVERESGIHTEDERMVHNQDYCLDYDMAGQYDAGFCEFHVQGFGNGMMGHYGIPYYWLVAYLQIGQQQGAVVGVGMYTRYHDADTGAAGQRFSLGIQVADGVWKTGFVYLTSGMMMGNYSYLVEDFAFFIDVRRSSGEVVRLWQSRHGANYSLSDVFSQPTTKEYIPYGNIQWANDESAVFDSRRICQ